MKSKGLVIIIVSILLISLLAPLTILAHSGKTDSNGGHYDNSTGEYHYHHGYPAHQHPNGKCPYDYEDKTNHSSGSGSSNSSSKKDSPDIFGFIMTSFGFGILFFIVAFFVCSKMKTDTSRKVAGWIIFIIWIIVSLIIGTRDYL